MTKIISLSLICLLFACTPSAVNYSINSTQAVLDHRDQSTQLHDYLVAELSYQQQDFDRAYSYYKDLSSDVPYTVSPVELRLVELNLLAGDPEAALASLERLNMEQDSSETLILQALLELSVERKTEARQLISAGLKALPDSLDLHLYQACQSLMLGDTPAKVVGLLGQTPAQLRNEDYYLLLGRVYELANNFSMAENSYRKALAIRYGDPIINKDLLRLLVKNNQFNEAINLIDEQKVNDFSMQVIKNYLEQDGSSKTCLLYTSPSPRDKRQSRMPSSA